MIHGLRGRPSNRKFAARFEQKILARVRQRYADFGSTLAAEHLPKEGLPVSRETLRKWMSKAAFWRPRSQRVKKIHVWRERRNRVCHARLAALICDVPDEAVARSELTRREIVRAGPAILQATIRGKGEPIVFIPSRGRSVKDFDALSNRLEQAGLEHLEQAGLDTSRSKVYVARVPTFRVQKIPQLGKPSKDSVAIRKHSLCSFKCPITGLMGDVS